jgi:ubiquinone/menaquinone biosynthesis C-methylase UbiE
METAAKKTFDFKAADAASYDAHVGDFERFTAMLTTPLAARTIAMANISSGQRVLDVGTGTGIVAVEAAKAIESRGECVAVDLSEKMLAGAKASAERASIASRIKFRTMDAESLDFDANSFDAVVSLFAVLHFPNPDIALNEMFRVLKPGGTVAIGVGSAPPWSSLVGLRHGLKLLPEMIARARGQRLVAPKFLERIVEDTIPARSEPEESPLAKASRSHTRSLPELIVNAGFVNLRRHWQGYQATLTTASDFWDIQRTFSSIARKRLNHATPDQVATAKAKFDAVCRNVLGGGGKLVYPVGAFFVAAERPSQS